MAGDEVAGDHVARDRSGEGLAGLIGGRAAKPLASHLGLHTVGDLLAHYPRRYLEHDRPTPLRDLEDGEQATVLAWVRSITARAPRNPRSRVRRIVDVVVSDGVGEMALRFFNHPPEVRALAVGALGLFTGKVARHQGRLELTHPLVSVIDVDDQGGPIPVYPLAGPLTSQQVWACARQVLAVLEDGELPDPLDGELRRRHGFPGHLESLRRVHRPRSAADAHAARHRLRYQEAYVVQVALARRRADAAARPGTARPARPGGLLEAFDARLPFTLTDGQRRVGAEIAEELADERPMQRLLQGEVGSGKTLVALRAMLQVVDAGGQAALLAPTEVLAVQHHRSISAMLGDLAEGGMLGGADQATRVALLTGSQPTAARRAAMLDIASGGAGIVVGTHALLSGPVTFADLGLVVVDEQHRFGVVQRDTLRAKGRTAPDVLVMTATPIPRTIAMTSFGDLQTSVLAELPRGRSPITSHVVPVAEHPTWMDRVWQRVRGEVDAGRRAYVVCQRIGDDEAAEGPVGEDGVPLGEPPAEDEPTTASVLATLEGLRAEPALAGLRIAPLHGRMPADAKEATMRAFAAGEVDVLVATTVIEVGVDVPEASVMVVLDAERFGVSQLHQLRGRVGRGEAASLCFLATTALEGSPGRGRVEGVAATLDGFALAELDLETRHEGDVLGSAQSGRRSSLHLLSVVRDGEVIARAREDATALVEADPDLSAHPVLAAAVDRALGEDREQWLERG